MAVFPTGEAFYGTSGVDTFKGGVGSDIFHMTADNFVTDSINGDFGADTVDYGASSVGVTITLTDPSALGGASGGTVEANFPMDLYNPWTGNYIPGFHHQVVANLQSIENATGSSHDDTLIGNSGNNVLNGGGGSDVIVGGGGHDVLTGGSGADTFVFNSVTDSSVGNPDKITDFEVGRDWVDPRGIDADTTASGNQQFHFP